MERRFEGELQNLKSRILEMGGYVEQAVEIATQALEERNAAKLASVHPLERKINHAHVVIDNACVEILARQSPFAADLRLIIAIIKINTDLERMGDQAVNISYNAEHYLADRKIDMAQDLTQMGKAVRVMVRKSLDAFMRQDIVLAQQVLESDDEVDAFKNKMFQGLLPFMKQEPQ